MPTGQNEPENKGMIRSPPAFLHRAGQISDNPFDSQKVQIQLKSAILFEGVESTEIPARDYTSEGATIQKWLPHGIMIDGGYYIPSANIACISPYQSMEEILAMRDAKGIKTLII